MSPRPTPDRPADFAAAVRCYQRAAIQVWNSHEVWAQELARADAVPLPWPIPPQRTNAAKWFAMLAETDVDVMASWMRHTRHPGSPDWPLRADDVKLQTLLRVVARSLRAGERAVFRDFGGQRITGKREFRNATNEQCADLALQLARDRGLTRDQAFDLLDIPRRQAFRSRRRALTRK